MPTWHDDDVEDPPRGYYRLLFGRSPVHTFGRTTNNRLLSEVMDENGVWVNRKVAERWGFKTGDRVYLQNQDGVRSTFSAPVKVTDRIHPDAVFVVHGYGRKARKLRQVYGKGIDDAELITRYKTDPVMGGTGMNVNFVTFLRAADVEAQATQEEPAAAEAARAEALPGRMGRRRELNGMAATGAGEEAVS
jgi:anaerobic selenocysteine-containing dehydrogenase